MEALILARLNPSEAEPEDRDLVGPRRARALVALHVGRQRGVADPGRAGDRGQNLGAVGHLRAPIWG